MGRSSFVFRHRLSAERSKEVAEKYLRERGLRNLTMKSGENVWKNGTGILLSAQLVSLYYENNKTTCYAWIQTGAGLTARSEMELDGIGSMLPKRMAKKIVDGLETALKLADPGYVEEEYAAWPEDEEETIEESEEEVENEKETEEDSEE